MRHIVHIVGVAFAGGGNIRIRPLDKGTEGGGVIAVCHVGGHLLAKVLGLALLIGLVTALIVTGVMKSQLKSVALQQDAASYVRQGSMKLTNQRDLFLYRDVHRTERPKESSSDDSGGSSTHTSSSGTTHGGGGGSF